MLKKWRQLRFAKNNIDRDKVEDLVYNVTSAMLHNISYVNPEAEAVLREKVAQQVLMACVLRSRLHGAHMASGYLFEVV